MEEIVTSFQYGIPAAIIVAAYLVINKFIDAKKERKRVDLSNELINSFNKLNNFLTYFTEDLIKKEQDKCEFAIKTVFNASAKEVLKFVINVIINNNVDNNKQTIIENIDTLINTEYWNMYSCLILYKSGEENVSDYLEAQWKDRLKTDIVNIIFEDKSKEERIYNANNKINIIVNSCMVHVLNKYATHKK